MPSLKRLVAKSNRGKTLQAILFIIIFGGLGTWALLGARADTSTLVPAHDLAANNVVGVGQSTTTALYKDVNDGSSFASADDNTSYVRGQNGVPKADHKTSYDAYPTDSTLTQVSVNVRAYKGSASGGSIQVLLYNGSTLIGTGAQHSLGSTYDNYTDTFKDLSIKGAQLSTDVILRNTGSSGAPRYTSIWLSSQFTNGTPTPTPTPTCPPGTTGTYPNCVTSTPTPSSSNIIRAAFYYPWFPETWGNLSDPFTNYHPTLGYYDSSNTSVITKHIQAMQYAHLDAGISSWWGQGQHQENTRFPAQLAAANGTGFKWTLYYEKEGAGNPAVSEISSDLSYIQAHYASNPNYLTKNGKPVIFVYGDGSDNCSTADRWKQANSAVGNSFYVVLKVFSGYQSCASQPDSWHQYGPAAAEDHQAGYSFVISPGFSKKGEAAPRLARDMTRWKQNITDMANSNEPWQLVTTFDEWGEGTAVESAQEWSSASGYGTYIDALHDLLPGTSSTTPTPVPTSGDPVVTAAGDIACDPTNLAFSGSDPTQCQQRATAQLVTSLNPTYALTLGDNQYESGTLANYQASYDTSWGAFKAKTKPILGNHEGGEGGSNTGYFDYFNGSGVQSGAAGDRSKGYYSYDIGKWHVVALNSNCGTYSFNGSNTGCAAGSPQEQWLKADLAAHPAACTLAYWHVPRFSSGSSHHSDATSDTTYTALWNDLYAAGVEVLLNGHDHDYERFQPLNPNGVVDSNGVAEFVVGTGGEKEYSFGTVVNGSAYRGTGFGVLQLTLHDNSYDWKFVNASGSAINDSGSAQCHSGTATPPPVDTTPPTAPSSLTGSATSTTSISLKWGASTDNVQVNGYRIYRNGNTIASVSGTTLSYNDTSALPSTTYDYQVSAFDLANNESALSNKVTVTTPAPATADTTPPSVPTNLKGTVVSSSQVNLAWAASTDNVGVAGYDIARDGTTLANGVATTSYGDNSVTAGKTYNYSVKARDAAGNLSSAATVSVTTPANTPPPPTGTGPCATTTAAPAKYKHVIWIWMENHSYSGVIGSTSAPYQTQLASQCATNTAMKDAGGQYNSLSNYIAGTTGLDSCSGGCSGTGVSTWNDCSPSASCTAPVDNIFRQVRATGGTAKSYEENMGSNCQLTGANPYAPRHNPAVYFTGGSDRQACATDDVPMGTTTSGNFLDALATDSSLPTFSFVTPNLCNDTHDCGVGTGDGWLKNWMPIIFNSAAYKSGDTAVVLWYDEDTPIPNVVMAPSVKHVVLNDSSYGHYSLLRSTEEMLGLPFLGKASSAPSFRSAYNL